MIVEQTPERSATSKAQIELPKADNQNSILKIKKRDRSL
jgi:hypothetical protein